MNRVSRSLEQGKFQLIIAGDGIRADMVNLVNSPSISGVVSIFVFWRSACLKTHLGTSVCSRRFL